MRSEPVIPEICPTCGRPLGKDGVEEDPEYGLFGWILLTLFGITPRPAYIAFRCPACFTELGRSRRPAVLARRTPRSTGR